MVLQLYKLSPAALLWHRGFHISGFQVFRETAYLSQPQVLAVRYLRSWWPWTKCNGSSEMASSAPLRQRCKGHRGLRVAVCHADHWCFFDPRSIVGKRCSHRSMDDYLRILNSECFAKFCLQLPCFTIPCCGHACKIMALATEITHFIFGSRGNGQLVIVELYNLV